MCLVYQTYIVIAKFVVKKRGIKSSLFVVIYLPNNKRLDKSNPFMNPCFSAILAKSEI